MTSPLPPRRRDTTTLADLLRQDRTNLRQLDPGLMGGRFSPTKPPEPFAEDDEEGGDDDASDTLVGQDSDRLVLADLGTQVWTLVGTPVEGTLVVRWHPDAGAGVEWKRGEHYTIADDTNVVVISATALATAGAQVDDVFSAQYLSWGDDADTVSEILPLDSLILVGASGSVNSPTSIPLPTGTAVGDLIVVGNATLHSDGTPGVGYPIDSRLAQVGHGAWIGIATDLSDVIFNDSTYPDRHTACVATFRAPANYKNDADVTGPGGTSSVTVPQVAANGAVMVFTIECQNGQGSDLTSYPAGYVMASNPHDGTTVCKAGILYWPPDGDSASPAGSAAYAANGPVYVTVIGLQGEEV